MACCPPPRIGISTVRVPFSCGGWKPISISVCLRGGTKFRLLEIPTDRRGVASLFLEDPPVQIRQHTLEYAPMVLVYEEVREFDILLDAVVEKIPGFSA